MPLSGNIGRDFYPVGEPHSSDFAQSGIGFFRGSGVYSRTHAAALRAGLERGSLAAFQHRFALFPDELVNGGHAAPPKNMTCRKQIYLCHAEKYVKESQKEKRVFARKFSGSAIAHNFGEKQGDPRGLRSHYSRWTDKGRMV
jgi:hypothetical protein